MDQFVGLNFSSGDSGYNPDCQQEAYYRRMDRSGCHEPNLYGSTPPRDTLEERDT